MTLLEVQVITNKPPSANKAGYRDCRWFATLNCRMFDATSLPVIKRSENPAPGHLSEGSMAVSCGSDSRRPDVRFSLCRPRLT